MEEHAVFVLKSRDTPGVAWLEWGAAAFARARAEQKAILLSITASWCDRCAVMEASYSKPEIAALIRDRFVPIRVDSDRRPDINDRYNLGGWPTTACLTPAGEILWGDTYMAPERLRDSLARVNEAFRTRRDEIEALAHARAAEDAESGEKAFDRARAEETVNFLCDRILDEFDATDGGFGAGAKFPHVPALMLALERYRDTGDERFGQVVTTTLDAMGWRGLWDPIDGGFFRYVEGADWSRPHRAKMLEDNAALLRLYLEAAMLLERAAYLDRARETLGWIENTLADRSDGGYFGSQRADEAYYALGSATARAAAGAPPIDRTYYLDWNAGAAAACLRASEIFGDTAVRDFALKSLERVLLATYRPGRGVAHGFDPHGPLVRGLLADQIQAAAALLDAFAITEQVPHSMLAEELMRYAVRTMWDEPGGGFVDRASDESAESLGLLGRRAKPLAANCDAARTLIRLASVAGEPEYRERGLQTLTHCAAAARAQGILGAAYGLAAREAML